VGSARQRRPSYHLLPNGHKPPSRLEPVDPLSRLVVIASDKREALAQGSASDGLVSVQEHDIGTAQKSRDRVPPAVAREE
jgi:hypothetical protein